MTTCQSHDKFVDKIMRNDSDIKVLTNRVNNIEKDIEEMKMVFNKLSEKVMSIQIKVAIGSVIIYTVINLALWYVKYH